MTKQPAPPPRILNWVGHYSPQFLILGACIIATLIALPAMKDSLLLLITAFSTPLTIPIDFYFHEQRFCLRCSRKLRNPEIAVQQRINQLGHFHRPWHIATIALSIIAALAGGIIAGVSIVGKLMVLGSYIGFAYESHVFTIHRLLKRWCPCHDSKNTGSRYIDQYRIR